VFNGIGLLPFFNSDVGDDALLPEVRRWRRAVATSDAILFCSPEYAGGLAGVLKNALEWLVGDVVADQKPVAVINTAPHAHHADDSLRLILKTMGVQLIEAASISLELPRRHIDACAITADAQLTQQLQRALYALASIAGHTEKPFSESAKSIPGGFS
jgi:chromate reductase, NAD(P)H dehydrogenase (quinone)